MSALITCSLFLRDLLQTLFIDGQSTDTTSSVSQLSIILMSEDEGLLRAVRLLRCLQRRATTLQQTMFANVMRRVDILDEAAWSSHKDDFG